MCEREGEGEEEERDGETLTKGQQLHINHARELRESEIEKAKYSAQLHLQPTRVSCVTECIVVPTSPSVEFL